MTSWGRLGQPLHDVVALRDPPSVSGQIRATAVPGLAYGMGRSYGDVCLNPGGVLWSTRGLDRFMDFDAQTGRLVCEAGVLLLDIQRLALARGWRLPVTPGTQLVTVGGAVANDVHGKNHHRFGSFGDQVRRLRLVRTDGESLDCGPDLRPDWFGATVGGMGLTGVMTEVELQLCQTPGPWLEAETLPFVGLDEFFMLADASEACWEHTVAWVDCLSGASTRGIFLRANPVEATTCAESPQRRRTMPLVPPISLVNRLTLSPFNQAYYYLNKWRAGRKRVHGVPFLYPLDNLLEWNRMYGPHGFFQYQCVVPREVGQEAISAMLESIACSGQGSFLSVLKTFGSRQPLGLLSFPRPGVTLALDFPNRGDTTLRLFERLDAIVAEAGGRLYAAKDARMPRSLFEQGYPRLGEFLAYRDPGVSSGLSRRLMGA